MAEAKGIDRRELIAAAGALGLLAARGNTSESPAAGSPDRVLAPTPPMGWNSWNSFATTLTEAQAIANAEIMAKQLKPFGYDIFTIDIQWYEGEATGYDYNTQQVHFSLSRFGLASARVRDLWAQQDLGISRERVTAALAPHACLLYSVTPV